MTMPDTAFPAGEHDRRLLENVRPPGWVNPEPRGRYHLVVVGAGTAGLVTAAIAAGLGARVALVERASMGGDCLNVGCVPSKAVIRAARAWSEARHAAERFGGPAVAGEGDFAAAMERMRRVRADMSAVDGAARFRGLGVDVFLGEGRFTAPDALEVGGARLGFRRAVIATGARAAAPPIPGLSDVPYLTNETVFSLDRRPAHLVVLGGGPIGCELAQAFARLGTRVTLLEAGERILPHDDADAAEIVAAALARDGVDLRTGAAAERVEPHGGGVRVRPARGGETADVDGSHLLVAVGRAPNVEGLGLEAAGVEYDRKVGVTVDDRLRTTSSRIYAIGDVASRYRFTHVADAHARMVVRNALFFGRGKASELVVPWCTYTSPELAHVGMTAAEAARLGGEVHTITIPMREVDRARLDGEEDGFLRVHLKRGSDTVLGATLVAERAGDLVTQLTQAMAAGTGLGTVGEAIFPYPTQAEVIRKAADAWRRTRLTPTAKSAFGLFFRAFR